MRKLLLILNPMAGTRQWRRFLPELMTIISEADVLPTVYLTRARGDGAACAARWAGDYDLIGVCGGDGTLNEVLSGLMAGGHRTPVGYLPAGSTNDFATGLGISTNLPEACRVLLTGKPRALDIGRFGNDRYFSYTASFGLFTAVSIPPPGREEPAGARRLHPGGHPLPGGCPSGSSENPGGRAGDRA